MSVCCDRERALRGLGHDFTCRRIECLAMGNIVQSRVIDNSACQVNNILKG